MIHQKLVKLSFVAIAAVQLLTMAPAPAAAQAARETYVSPTYGYSLTYDGSWEVRNQVSDQYADSIHLSNETSYMMFVGTDRFGDDAEDCVAGTIDAVTAAPAFGELTLATDLEGNPMAGGDATSAFVVYDYLYTNQDGTQELWTLNTQCLTLIPGEATLAIIQDVPEAAYNDELGTRESLVAGLTLTATSATTADQPTDAAPGELSFTDAVLAWGGDLDAFWTEQFANADEYYIRPFYAVVEESLVSACDAPLLAAAPTAAAGLGVGEGPLYCPLDQTIYLDAPYMQEVINQVGPAGLIAIMAHEAGHHVQMQLGLSWEERSVVTELQAECFAGAYVADAVARGLVTEEEVMALEPLVLSVGDTPEMSADDPDSHGNGTQRWAMFLRGYGMGAADYSVLAACEM
jgi:predicted metalloprotease